MVNAYGPTETTVWASWHVCDALAPSAPPIGRPIANTRIHILDDHLQPVPVGVTGELYIGGAGVARGYLNRPGLTAERFLRDPFSAGSSARLYKTGDLGRYLADGTIEYIGRNDFQVKIRGFRIELGEIEARLAALPAVREAAVIVREDEPGDRRLTAYIVWHAGQAQDAASVRAALSAQLAHYMVPGAFVSLDALPLTVNGKLDRKALPATGASVATGHAYRAPAGALEVALADIWSTLLKVGQVGCDDNFFELGGNSILTARVVHEASRRGLRLATRDMFIYPTLQAARGPDGGGRPGRPGAAGRRRRRLPPLSSDARQPALVPGASAGNALLGQFDGLRASRR